MQSIWLRDHHADEKCGLTQSRADRITWLFLILGIVVCTVRFCLRFPLWHDESFLAINFARRDFAGILEPLEYHQVAPPLFLLAQMLVIKAAGFTEWTLRLIPYLCMIFSFVLFRRIARHVLDRRAYVFSVAIFSVSYWLIRYSAEAKPYAVDVMVALLLIGLFIRWRDGSDRSSQRRVLIALCALSFVAFGLSFPSVFIGGGICVSIALTARARHSTTPLWSAVAVGASLSLGFVLVYWLHLSQRSGTEDCRDYQFLDLILLSLHFGLPFEFPCVSGCRPAGHQQNQSAIVPVVMALAAGRSFRLTKKKIAQAPTGRAGA